MCMTAIISSVVAWVVGLVIDANLMFNDCGFLMLRVLLPMLTMGAFIIKSNQKNDK